jgi:CO/xanthine dehydrogenase FAD-binding subunit
LSDPVDDVRATADYRRLVIPRMVVRAAAEAADLEKAA